jgi:Domain of Unknown Function (DUF1080)/FG-GAP-like repeat
MLKRRLLFTLMCVVAGGAHVFAAGPSFYPDATFQGSNLNGWHTLGDADWRAESGELVGTPKDSGGGWLVLDRSYQDIGLYAQFQCTGVCETGVLFRIEKTAGGMKGIYVSLTPSMKYYQVTLDAQGKILERTEVARAGGQRIASPPSPNNSNHPIPGHPKYNVTLPFAAPDSGLRPDTWNEVEFFLDANILRGFLNNGPESGGMSDEGYGPFALYIGAGGEVRFKQLAYKDLEVSVRAPEETSPNFRKQQLDPFYYSWGADAADFNHDGILDVVSGPYIYYGPDYRKRREVYLGQTSNPSTEYASDAFMEFAADFTGDGWPDVLTCIFMAPNNCFLYVNPRGESRRWDKFAVVSGFQTEIAMVRDINGDGKPAVIYGGDGYVRYAKPDPQNPTGPWIVHNVSQQGYVSGHGIGVGDINGDGRLDIVNPYGWWEQPPAGSEQETWTYHPEVFGRYGRGIMGGSEMAIYDVNGDGLNDVVTILNVHGWGLFWFEQKRDAQGKISFVRHLIMDDLWTKNAGGVAFSQGHGTTSADVDGDGIPDFIVGKRYWSHLDDYYDPNPYGAPVLYWYQTVRNPKAPGGAEFVPHLIDNRSGAGSNLKAIDLNKDGAMDIITATRFGTYIFWGKPNGGKKSENNLTR